MEQKPIHNIFLKPEIAEAYENFYQKETGEKIDQIEQQLLSRHLKRLEETELLELAAAPAIGQVSFVKKDSG